MTRRMAGSSLSGERMGFANVIEGRGIVQGAEIAGIAVEKVHVDGPQGVRGRNSDNSKLREVLGWEPQISLERGLAKTYAWIEGQVRASVNAPSAATANAVRIELRRICNKSPVAKASKNERGMMFRVKPTVVVSLAFSAYF